MKKPINVGNVTFVIDKPARPENWQSMMLLMGKKPPPTTEDLARGHRKVGSGKWVPLGGGIEDCDASIQHSAKREVMEESGLAFPVENFQPAGILHGYIVGKRNPIWEAHLFVVEKGKVYKPLFFDKKEYSEMCWFRAPHLPFFQMIDGDMFWIPDILRGRKLCVEVWHDSATFKLARIRVTRFEPAP